MPLNDQPLDPPQQDLIKRWIDSGAPKGIAAAAASDRPHQVRWVRSLEVRLPCEVNLPAGTASVPERRARARRVARESALLLAVTSSRSAAMAACWRSDPTARCSCGTSVRRPPGRRPAGDLPGPVHALAFSRDGRRVQPGEYDN